MTDDKLAAVEGGNPILVGVAVGAAAFLDGPEIVEKIADGVKAAGEAIVDAVVDGFDKWAKQYDWTGAIRGY